MTNARPNSPSHNTRIGLFAQSGNKCAFPGCDARMFEENSVLGEMCHIHGQRPGAARYLEGMNQAILHSAENLILLCPVHHKLVDDNPEQYAADVLRDMKQKHESRTRPATVPSRLASEAHVVPLRWESSVTEEYRGLVVRNQGQGVASEVVVRVRSGDHSRKGYLVSLMPGEIVGLTRELEEYDPEPGEPTPEGATVLAKAEWVNADGSSSLTDWREVPHF